MAKKWMLKNDRGEITGPYDEQEVFDKILLGQINGKEKISSHPSGIWQPFETHQKFYAKFLEQVEEDLNPAVDEESVTRELDLNPEDDDKTQVIHNKPGHDISFQGTRPTGAPRRPEEKLEFARSAQSSAKDEANFFSSDQDISHPTIDLKRKSPKKKRRRKKKLNKIPIYFFLLFLVVIYLILDDEPNHGVLGKVSFVGPQKFTDALPQSDFDIRFNRVLQVFQRDTFENYKRVQNQLVDLIEIAGNQPKAYALLCLTYRELWPYSTQSTEDKAVVSAVTQKLAQIDPLGVNSSTCRTVNHLIAGQIERARGITNKVLKDHPNEPVFYEIKAQFLKVKNEYLTAVAYVQRAQQIWPGWLKLHLFEGQLKTLSDDAPGAGRIYRKILEDYSRHTGATIELGLLELNQFGNQQLGIELINQGFNLGEVNPEVATRAAVDLAKYYQFKGNGNLALDWAKTSYKNDPTNQVARNLILELGGEKALEPLQPTDIQMIALGDNFYRSGNYLAAQAEYRAAFSSNGRNAEAALKAGQSLWRLYQTDEAIEWVRKSITANPKYIDGYVTLADYLSSQFEFEQAAVALKRAQAISPQNHKIYRGLALVEYRKRNYPSAESFAMKALNIYDADVESHLILSEALLAQSKYQEAYQYTSRAIELDGQNVDSQSLYGRVLAKFQSKDTGVEYLLELISTYPQLIEYRIALSKVYMEFNEHNKAIPVLKQIIQAYPKNHEANVLLGKSYEETAQPNQAIKAYLTAAIENPSDPTPLFETGFLYMKARKYREAVDQFKKVLSVNDRYPRANFLIGRAYLNIGNYKLATEYAKKEKQHNPNLADPYILQAEAFMGTKNYVSAISELQKASQLRPNSAEVFILLARCYRLNSNLGLATTMIGKALKVESGNAEIYKEQGAVFEAQGKVSDAIMAYRQYLKLFPNAPDRSIIQSKISSLGG